MAAWRQGGGFGLPLTPLKPPLETLVVLFCYPPLPSTPVCNLPPRGFVKPSKIFSEKRGYN